MNPYRNTARLGYEAFAKHFSGKPRWHEMPAVVTDAWCDAAQAIIEAAVDVTPVPVQRDPLVRPDLNRAFDTIAAILAELKLVVDLLEQERKRFSQNGESS